MNIIPSSIKVIFSEFNNLEDKLGTTDYSPHFEGYIFKIKGPLEEFTIEDLQTIVRSNTLNPIANGYLDACTFNDAEEIIDGYLAYAPSNINFSNKEKMEHKKEFWSIIASIFVLPPMYCLEHYPDPDSYFAQGAFMWNFTYCFFKEEKGLLIHGCASD